MTSCVVRLVFEAAFVAVVAFATVDPSIECSADEPRTSVPNQRSVGGETW